MKKISFPLYSKAPDFSRAIYDAKNKTNNIEVSGLIEVVSEGAQSLENNFTQSLGLHKLVDTIYSFKSTVEDLAKLLDADPEWLIQIEPHHRKYI